jgi:hypothetical protein
MMKTADTATRVLLMTWYDLPLSRTGLLQVVCVMFMVAMSVSQLVLSRVLSIIGHTQALLDGAVLSDADVHDIVDGLALADARLVGEVAGRLGHGSEETFDLVDRRYHVLTHATCPL